MGRKRNRRRRNSRPAPGSAKLVADFWGSVDKLPEVETVPAPVDAYAVIRSLGRPPFSGHEAVSEHYLRSVCQSAGQLAEALATAGGIMTDPGEGSEPDDGMSKSRNGSSPSDSAGVR